jgi:hypothetical protein
MNSIPLPTERDVHCGGFNEMFYQSMPRLMYQIVTYKTSQA